MLLALAEQLYISRRYSVTSITCGLVLSADIHDTIGIDIEGHLYTIHAKDHTRQPNCIIASHR